MELFKTMRTRCSVREYRDEPLTEAELEQLAEAALLAPTSLNLQQQKFFFVTDPAVLGEMTRAITEVSRQRGETDYLERLAQRGGKVFFGAPLVVVIAVNPENNYIEVDAGIAVQNLALAARALGLDSVIMAAPDRIFFGPTAEKFEKMLGFPSGYRFAIAIAIGRRAAEFIPHQLKRENVVFVSEKGKRGEAEEPDKREPAEYRPGSHSTPTV